MWFHTLGDIWGIVTRAVVRSVVCATINSSVLEVKVRDHRD